ncbi:MAG: ATP-binding protein, partial [Ilumatobacteraceae bacterium]
FTAVQATLVDVAAEQMDVLRRGVADIFVTLARRNRSLVDRQLAMLDDLEANVEDPELLSDYYKLDHLATRMRRSAESLLVLANSDTQRRRSGPVEIDDVVRAAMSEVEDYRRIDVLALESLQIKGPLVADTSHLLAELLDNAASFSPPDSRVAVAGHFTGTGYLITISDRGVGIPGTRLQELNDLLTKPPVIGLSVEPTLGLTVVSMLAAKHGIRVSLVQAAPGISVNIVVPPAMYQHTVDVEAQPSFDAIAPPSDAAPTEPVEAVEAVEARATDEDAVRATSSALDAIAALNRAHEAQVGSRDATAPAELGDQTSSDLPKRQPTGGDLPRRGDAEQSPAEPPVPAELPSHAAAPSDITGELSRPEPAAPSDITSEPSRPEPAAASDITSELPRRQAAEADAGGNALPRREPAAFAADGPEVPQRPLADVTALGSEPIVPITPERVADDGASSTPASASVDAASPTIIEPAPQPLVPDFRPGPAADPASEPPVMPAPTPGDVRVPDLAPPPAPEPAAESAQADLTSSGLPMRRPGEAEPLTDAGLPRRGPGGAVPAEEQRPVAASAHDPDALRSTLSAFHTSTQLGRLEGTDAPTHQAAGGED